MPRATPLTRRLAMTHPIIAAPMAGGGSTPALVAAVGEAGGLGSLAGAYSSGAQIAEMCAAVRARSTRPFAINLFAPLAVPPVPSHAASALARLAPYHAELGLPAPALPARAAEDFDEQMAAVLESGAAIFSFTFGIPSRAALDAARARGIVNRFMNEVEDPAAPAAVLPYPLQNALTRLLRSAAGKAGRAEFLSLWAGQGVRLARQLPAGALVARIAAELDATIALMREP
jgi:NAD(P)H-dependent flavin oxidoreductase YrpB (nitropropane dioxygenase family)